MNGFLIDTNVLSEYNRPQGPDLGVKRWLETTDRASQYVSVIRSRRSAKESSCSPREGDAASWKRGLNRIWRSGLQGGSYRWIER